MTQQRVSVGGAPTRCPYCKDELDASRQELVGCAECGARQHASCHERHGSCAACGSTKTLFARVAPTRRGPLAGSKIQVTSEGEATTYRWPTYEQPLWLHVLVWTVVVLIPPLWPLVLIPWLKETPESKALRKAKEQALTVTPDAIEVVVMARTSRKRVRLRRERIGAPKVIYAGEHGTPKLVIDEGVTRHTLFATAGLAAPELEWLAEQLAAWHAEG